MSTDLEARGAEVVELLGVSNYVNKAAPKAAEKRKAAFEIGQILKEIFPKFNRDKEYGEWIRSDIIEKCPSKIPTRTLFRYRMLATFTDDLEVAERIGFTNIYKLMEDKFEKERKIVLENHHKYEGKELKEFIQLTLTGEVYLSDVDKAKMEANNWKEKYEEAKEAVGNNANVKSLSVTSRALLGIGSEEKLTPRIISKAYRALANKHHPDKGGSEEMMNALTVAKESLIAELSF